MQWEYLNVQNKIPFSTNTWIVHRTIVKTQNWYLSHQTVKFHIPFNAITKLKVCLHLILWGNLCNNCTSWFWWLYGQKKLSFLCSWHCFHESSMISYFYFFSPSYFWLVNMNEQNKGQSGTSQIILKIELYARVWSGHFWTIIVCTTSTTQCSALLTC